jgi:isopenicillin-N N-acyltransferase-like protein
MAVMFPLIDLNGSPAERGRQHGAAARERVARSLANYADLFQFCGMSWDQARSAAAPYRDLIGNFDAALLEEIQGIARGAGQREEDILVLNVRTEILPTAYLAGGEEADVGECTAIAVSRQGSATGEALLAQNWDWVGAQRQTMVLLRTPEYLTLSEGGMLAKIGLNRSGFGVCLNILRSNFDGSRTGVPVHVLLRALLERNSVADAAAFASGLAFGGSSNILCADKSGDLAALEFSPRGLKVVRGDGATLCHTNHFLHPEALDWQAAVHGSFSTEPRLACARGHAALRPKQSIEDLKRLLRDQSDGLHSICREPDPAMPPQLQVESVASVIMELEQGVMHVAPHVPSRVDYEPVSLSVSNCQVALAQ